MKAATAGRAPSVSPIRKMRIRLTISVLFGVGLLALLFEFMTLHLFLTTTAATQQHLGSFVACGENGDSEASKCLNPKLGSLDRRHASQPQGGTQSRHDSSADAAARASMLTNNRQQLPSNATGRAFVCITGQVKRLAVEKIMQTLLEPLKHQGYEVDVALALSDDALHSTYTNVGRWKWAPFSKYEQVHSYFSTHGYNVVTNASLSLPEDPAVPPNYVKNIHRSHLTREQTKVSAQNHWRQFITLTKCHEALHQQQVSSTVTSKQTSSDKSPITQVDDNYYDFSIRLREDVSFEEPLIMDDILPLLYPNASNTAASHGTVLSSDCRHYGGMNDRLAIVSRQGFHSYFNGPWDYFLPDKSAHEGKVNNPESYIKYVYQNELNMNVVRTRKLRSVLKYVVVNEGSNEHPRLVTKTAPGEQNTFCPIKPHL